MARAAVPIAHAIAIGMMSWWNTANRMIGPIGLALEPAGDPAIIPADYC